MSIETAEGLLVETAKILDDLKIQYYITGGFAVSIWGRPRATFDVDIVVKLLEPDVAPLAKALRKISEFGYIDEDTAREALNKKGEFNFIHPESGLKIDFWIQQSDEFGLVQFKRKKNIMINNKKVTFISPEDLIISKLLWYQKSGSTRHMEDIQSVFKISGTKLDLDYLRKWAGKIKAVDILSKYL